MEIHFQKILSTCDSKFEVARRYYVILCELNNIKITKNELNLLAYSAVYGTLSTPPVRDEFMRRFKIPKHSMYNMIGKLKKLNILIKDKEKKIRVNPQILPDFNKNLVLAIKLENIDV